MSKTYKVISDVHGMYIPYRKVLNDMNFTKEILVVNGDLINKGVNSYYVLSATYTMQKVYPNNLHVLLGNHELILLLWLFKGKKFKKKHRSFYEKNKLAEIEKIMYRNLWKYIAVTVLDFYRNNNILCKKASISYEKFYEEFPYICDWLVSLPFIYETKKLLVVHGGLDIRYPTINAISDIEKLLYRNWWNDVRKTDYSQLIVFGHTPVKNIHGTHDIYHNEKNNIVGIDGAISQNGQLNCVTIKKGRIKDITVYTK